ncbi:MAG TPA: hypothetical protein EYQ71_09065 [Candidatus Thioglobus sp.]|nr:hypothetical protein [Candidatus Thioglobus sp.]
MSETGDISYFDRNSIKEHNGYIYWWELNDMLKPNEDGVMSDKQYKQGDCGVGRYKTLRFIFYVQSMGKGAGEGINDDAWMYPSPGTIGRITLDYACNYVK